MRPFPVRLLTALVFCIVCVAQNDSRVPAEVRYKHGYVNIVGKPAEFTSAMLWGITIADTQVPGYEQAQVEIQQTRLTCSVDNKDVILNDDPGHIRGGLYRRFPWFGTDAHDPIPLAYSEDHKAVILHVGRSPERVWHFWAASPRALIPSAPSRRVHGQRSGQGFERCATPSRLRLLAQFHNRVWLRH